MTVLQQTLTDRRALRYKRRATIKRVGDGLAAAAGSWDAVPFARTCACGVVCVDDAVSVYVRDGDDGPNAFPVGLSTCGSVWLCPVCSAKIRTRRQLEVELVARANANSGGLNGMFTLTIRHDSQHTLAELMDAQAAAWRSLIQSAQWRDQVKPYIHGYVRSWEITHSFFTSDRGSWHPHFHVLLLWSGEPGNVEWIADAWKVRVMARLGARGEPDHHGFDYRLLDESAAGYVAKIGAEMTRADLKGSAQIWQLIDGLDDGEAWIYKRFLEYATGTKGRRAIQMSRGLRDKFGLRAELSDEDLANDEAEGVLVMTVEPRKWARLARCGWGETPGTVRLLERLERQRAGPPIRGGPALSADVEGQLSLSDVATSSQSTR